MDETELRAGCLAYVAMRRLFRSIAAMVLVRCGGCGTDTTARQQTSGRQREVLSIRWRATSHEIVDHHVNLQQGVRGSSAIWHRAEKCGLAARIERRSDVRTGELSRSESCTGSYNDEVVRDAVARLSNSATGDLHKGAIGAGMRVKTASPRGAVVPAVLVYQQSCR